MGFGAPLRLVRKNAGDGRILRRFSQRKHEQEADVAVLVEAHQAVALGSPLNLEAADHASMAAKRDALLARIEAGV